MSGLLHSIDYERPEAPDDRCLFDYWEFGRAHRGMSTPSVASRVYRSLIVSFICHHVPCRTARLISLGCGNGFTETALQKEGIRVTATDVSPVAVSYARVKGLQARVLDVRNVEASADMFDIVYCDGLMGHLWSRESKFGWFFRAVRNLLRTGGLLVVSNDLADDDDQVCLAVTGRSESGFFRGPRWYITRQLIDCGRWSVIDDRVVEYDRPGRGIRRRQILAATVLER